MLKHQYTLISYSELSTPRQMILLLDYGIMIFEDEPTYNV